MQLSGLADAGASASERAPFVESLKAEQNQDGSWSLLPGYPGEAYATGEALYALHVSGDLPTKDSAYERGVQWLLRNQLADGSWFMPTRAVPVQPHTFESGFPARLASIRIGRRFKLGHYGATIGASRCSFLNLSGAKSIRTLYSHPRPTNATLSPSGSACTNRRLQSVRTAAEKARLTLLSRQIGRLFGIRRFWPLEFRPRYSPRRRGQPQPRARSSSGATGPAPPHSEPLHAVPYIIPGQLFAAHLTEVKGLDPDRPRRLPKITRTIWLIAGRSGPGCWRRTIRQS